MEELTDRGSNSYPIYVVRGSKKLMTTILEASNLSLKDVQRLLSLERQVNHSFKFLTISPLMWLSGFYSSKIKISLEEKIADIFVEDEDTLIKGRMDILAVHKIQSTTTTPFWILVIETKNVTVNAFEGLPQLLTYAYKGLENQESVWGLTTNGMNYQFVYLEKGNPSTYHLLPDLNVIYPERSIELLQVLKAICAGISSV
jgi:hypothetical protein